MKADRKDILTKLKIKEYQKVTGKYSWLAQGTKPDLSYMTLQMSKKNPSVTIIDLWKVNKVLKKVTSKESKIFNRRIGKKEDLQIVHIGDASFKPDEKVLLLVNQNFKKASPIYWKTKQIERLCQHLRMQDFDYE